MNDLISRLSEIRSKYNFFDETEEPYYRALSEAIQQLSAQPEKCEDAVSREEAKWVVFCHRDHVEDQVNAIDELPSVRPSAQPDFTPSNSYCGHAERRTE